MLVVYVVDCTNLVAVLQPAFYYLNLLDRSFVRSFDFCSLLLLYSSSIQLRLYQYSNTFVFFLLNRRIEYVDSVRRLFDSIIGVLVICYLYAGVVWCNNGSVSESKNEICMMMLVRGMNGVLFSNLKLTWEWVVEIFLAEIKTLWLANELF